MPAESQRLRRRISRRDRLFLALLALLAIAGTPGAVLLLPTGPPSRPDSRCVTTVRASIVGGATYRYCGASAAVACRQYATGDKAFAAQCQKLDALRRRSKGRDTRPRARPAFSTLAN